MCCRAFISLIDVCCPKEVDPIIAIKNILWIMVAMLLVFAMCGFLGGFCLTAMRNAVLSDESRMTFCLVVG